MEMGIIWKTNRKDELSLKVKILGIHVHTYIPRQAPRISRYLLRYA